LNFHVTCIETERDAARCMHGIINLEAEYKPRRRLLREWFQAVGSEILPSFGAFQKHAGNGMRDAGLELRSLVR